MIAAIVLAAGASTRMAPRNKLLVEGADRVAMVARVVRACCDANVGSVLVVTGHQAAAVERAIRPVAPNIGFVHAADHARGMSASLRAGIGALPASAEAALVCLGDMPLVTAAMMNRVLAGWGGTATIVVPSHGGRRGNPVLWGRRHFAEICTLTGDVGARGLLARHAGQVGTVEIDNAAVLTDFDTPESLAPGF